MDDGVLETARVLKGRLVQQQPLGGQQKPVMFLTHLNKKKKHTICVSIQIFTCANFIQCYYSHSKALKITLT